MTLSAYNFHKKALKQSQKLLQKVLSYNIQVFQLTKEPTESNQPYRLCSIVGSTLITLHETSRIFSKGQPGVEFVAAERCGGEGIYLYGTTSVEGRNSSLASALRLYVVIKSMDEAGTLLRPW